MTTYGKRACIYVKVLMNGTSVKLESNATSESAVVLIELRAITSHIGL